MPPHRHPRHLPPTCGKGRGFRAFCLGPVTTRPLVGTCGMPVEFGFRVTLDSQQLLPTHLENLHGYVRIATIHQICRGSGFRVKAWAPCLQVSEKWGEGWRPYLIRVRMPGTAGGVKSMGPVCAPFVMRDYSSSLI